MRGMTTLHFRESLPWLGAGVGVVVALFGLAMAIAGGTGESIGGLAAVIFWILIVPGAYLIVKGLLVLTEGMSSIGTVVLAVLAIVIAVIAVILHNIVSAVVGFEEGFFFMIALFGAPLLLVAAIIRAFRPGGGSPGHTALPSV